MAATATLQPTTTRRVHIDGVWADVPVYRREVIGAGTQLAGPAIIEEPYAVIVLPADWSLQCTASGELLANLVEVSQ